MTTTKLAVNTELKASTRAIGLALFKALLPLREEIGNRAFRTFQLDRLPDSSGPTVYNYAKTTCIADGTTPDFSRSAGEKIGSIVEMTDEREAEIHALLDEAEATAHTTAQQNDLEWRQGKADKKQAEDDAKAAKAKEREDAKAAREAKAKEDKDAKAKAREEAKALKAKEKADAKEAAEKAKAAKKDAAKKVAEEQPEMKWQLVNKTTNEVVEYAPDRKIGLELKKKREDAADIKVVKIPAVTA